MQRISVTYPRLIRRIQAVLIDFVTFQTVFFGFLILSSKFGVEQQWIKVVIFFAPLVVLEPVMVSVTGGTIGHHITGIRVKSSSRDENINIILATFRTTIKFVFGWLSLIFVLITRRHQAIHDFISRSVVVNKNASRLPAYELLSERVIEQAGYFYPAMIRRVIVIIAYFIFIFAVLSLLNSVFLSVNCLERNICNQYERLGQNIVGVLMVIFALLILIFGWKARLYGCRRKKISAAS